MTAKRRRAIDVATCFFVWFLDRGVARMLSTTADHALRAVLFLARQTGRVVSSDEIARAIGAPRNYLSKTLYALRNAGIVASVAGRNGGFFLAADPTTLPIADVIDQFEPSPTLTRCRLGDRPCDPAHPCAAHTRWSAITQPCRDGVERTTVADLLVGSTTESRQA